MGSFFRLCLNNFQKRKFLIDLRDGHVVHEEYVHRRMMSLSIDPFQEIDLPILTSFQLNPYPLNSIDKITDSEK